MSNMTHIKVYTQRKNTLKILCSQTKIYPLFKLLMMIKIAINILQFEVIKVRVDIKKIHIKRVKNTVIMSKNNKKMGSIFVIVKDLLTHTRGTRGG